MSFNLPDHSFNSYKDFIVKKSPSRASYDKKGKEISGDSVSRSRLFFLQADNQRCAVDARLVSDATQARESELVLRVNCQFYAINRQEVARRFHIKSEILKDPKLNQEALEIVLWKKVKKIRLLPEIVGDYERAIAEVECPHKPTLMKVISAFHKQDLWDNTVTLKGSGNTYLGRRSEKSIHIIERLDRSARGGRGRMTAFLDVISGRRWALKSPIEELGGLGVRSIKREYANLQLLHRGETKPPRGVQPKPFKVTHLGVGLPGGSTGFLSKLHDGDCEDLVGDSINFCWGVCKLSTFLTQRQREIIVEDVLSGLVFSQSKGLVYTDLKLENVFVDRDSSNNCFRAYIGDWDGDLTLDAVRQAADRGSPEYFIHSPLNARADEYIKLKETRDRGQVEKFYEGLKQLSVFQLGIFAAEILSSGAPAVVYDNRYYVERVHKPYLESYGFSDEALELLVQMMSSSSESRPSLNQIEQTIYQESFRWFKSSLAIVHDGSDESVDGNGKTLQAIPEGLMLAVLGEKGCRRLRVPVRHCKGVIPRGDVRINIGGKEYLATIADLEERLHIKIGQNVRLALEENFAYFRHISVRLEHFLSWPESARTRERWDSFKAVMDNYTVLRLLEGVCHNTPSGGNILVKMEEDKIHFFEMKKGHLDGELWNLGKSARLVLGVKSDEYGFGEKTVAFFEELPVLFGGVSAALEMGKAIPLSQTFGKLNKEDRQDLFWNYVDAMVRVFDAGILPIEHSLDTVMLSGLSVEIADLNHSIFKTGLNKRVISVFGEGFDGERKTIQALIDAYNHSFEKCDTTELLEAAEKYAIYQVGCILKKLGVPYEHEEFVALMARKDPDQRPNIGEFIGVFEDSEDSV